MLRLGQHYLESARLPRIAQPYLQRLSTQTGEIAMLSVLDGMDCVYIARNGPNRAMNSGFVLGSRVPGYTTSAGMLMLAHQSVEAIDEWLAKTPLPAFTDYTITDPVLMRRILMQIRQQGWSLSEQQFDVGFRGVAFVRCLSSTRRHQLSRREGLKEILSQKLGVKIRRLSFR